MATKPAHDVVRRRVPALTRLKLWFRTIPLVTRWVLIVSGVPVLVAMTAMWWAFGWREAAIVGGMLVLGAGLNYLRTRAIGARAKDQTRLEAASRAAQGRSGQLAVKASPLKAALQVLAVLLAVALVLGVVAHTKF